MSSPRDQVPLSVASTGDELVRAWRREEARQSRARRRRRSIALAAVCVVSLAVPSALATRSWLTGSPGPQRDLSRNGAALVLAEGAIAGQPWQLTSFSRSGTPCLGLREGERSQSSYHSVCDPQFPNPRRLTVGTASVGTKTIVYGAVAEKARRVRVTAGTWSVLAPTIAPQAPTRLRRGLPTNLRVYVVQAPGTLSSPLAVRLP